MMRFVKVESSNLDRVGYCPRKKVLRVEFKNNTTYEYSPIKGFEYKDLINAESVGKHFNQFIKNKEGIQVFKIEQVNLNEEE